MIDTKTTWNKVIVWVYWFLALEVKWFLAVVIAQYNIAEVRNKATMISDHLLLFLENCCESLSKKKFNDY